MIRKPNRALLGVPVATSRGQPTIPACLPPVSMTACRTPLRHESCRGRASGELDWVTVRVTYGGDAGAGTTGSRASPTRRNSQRDACSRPDTVSSRSHYPISRSGTHAPVASPAAIKGYSHIRTWGSTSDFGEHRTAPVSRTRWISIEFMPYSRKPAGLVNTVAYARKLIE